MNCTHNSFQTCSNGSTLLFPDRAQLHYHQDPLEYFMQLCFLQLWSGFCQLYSGFVSCSQVFVSCSVTVQFVNVHPTKWGGADSWGAVGAEEGAVDTEEGAIGIGGAGRWRLGLGGASPAMRAARISIDRRLRRMYCSAVACDFQFPACINCSRLQPPSTISVAPVARSPWNV